MVRSFRTSTLGTCTTDGVIGSDRDRPPQFPEPGPLSAPSAPRAKLLAAAVDHVLASHGLSDLSLRELAVGIGTSHRMLIYHFGSKEGLIVAVIQTVEAAERDAVRPALASPEDLALGDVLRAMWKRVSPTEPRPARVLSFFEIYGQALQGRPGRGRPARRCHRDPLGRAARPCT